MSQNTAVSTQPDRARAPSWEESQRSDSYAGSSFSEVWSAVQSDPYPLPSYEVTLGSFFAGMTNHLMQAARRTIDDSRDLLPTFRKLIRPNGICLRGDWRITESNPYSGFFEAGRHGLLVARASVGMTRTERGHYRSFGFAGKLFPTDDPDRKVRTANFFLIDDNGGTLLPHYLDTELLTEAKLSLNPSALHLLPVLLAVTIAQRLADKNSELRQLYPVAEAGVPAGGRVRVPGAMMLRSDTDRRVEEPDFRDELRVAHYGGVLPFGIYVRDGARDPWSRIGRIEFREDVVSASGDTRLHFSHPRWKRLDRDQRNAP